VLPPPPRAFREALEGKTHNDAHAVRESLRWWASLCGEEIDITKAEPVLRGFEQMCLEGGWAWKACDGETGAHGKRNADCCGRVCYVSESVPDETVLAAAIRKGLMPAEWDVDGEMARLMRRAFRASTVTPNYNCIDIDLNVGLVKM
jgi:hypothetical protein